jgi:hypothetical protein
MDWQPILSGNGSTVLGYVATGNSAGTLAPDETTYNAPDPALPEPPPLPDNVRSLDAHRRKKGAAA